MRLFIRTSDIAGKAPQVIASYPGNTVAPDLHGPDMTMLEVPDTLLLAKLPDEPFPRLPDDWRVRLGEPILQAEAERRIEGALSRLEQMTSLRETVELILEHGSDVSQWPAAATQRKAELDEVWKYVREVSERARTKSLPSNPVSDKNWPARIAKK